MVGTDSRSITVLQVAKRNFIFFSHIKFRISFKFGNNANCNDEEEEEVYLVITSERKCASVR